MKRHQSLIPLTHDHHHALAQARKLKLAAKDTAEVQGKQAREFLEFFEAGTLMHFREEEELVFPIAVRAPEAEPVLTRLMMEHLRVHAAIRDLRDELQQGDVHDDTLVGIAEQLESHIRFEEKTAFPLFEQIAETELTGVVLAPRDRQQDKAD